MVPAVKGLRAVLEGIDRYENVVLCEMPPEVQSRIVEYCFQHSIRSYIIPKITDIMLTSCFLALFALQTFACGLILDTQNQKSRQNFEIEMNIQISPYSFSYFDRSDRQSKFYYAFFSRLKR